jgi:hypothetical protein
LAEAHGFHAHAFGGDAGIDLASVADFDALLGVTPVIDIREVFACDFKPFRVDSKGGAAVVQ